MSDIKEIDESLCSSVQDSILESGLTALSSEALSSEGDYYIEYDSEFTSEIQRQLENARFEPSLSAFFRCSNTIVKPPAYNLPLPTT